MKEDAHRDELHFQPLARANALVVRRLFAQHENRENDDNRSSESERAEHCSDGLSISGSDFAIRQRLLSR